MLDAFVGSPVGVFVVMSIALVLSFFVEKPKSLPKLKFLDSNKPDESQMKLIDAVVVESEAAQEEQTLCLVFLEDQNLAEIKRSYDYILGTNEKLSNNALVSEAITKKSNRLTKQATEIIKKTGELYHLKDGILLGAVELDDGKSEFVDYRELTLDKLEHLKEALMLLLQSTSDRVIDDLQRIDIDKSISGSKAIIRFNDVLYRGKKLAESLADISSPTQEGFNVNTIVNKRMDELYDAYLAAFLNDHVNSSLAQTAFHDALDAIENYFSRLETGTNSNAQLAIDDLNINVRYIESITKDI